MYSLPKPKNSLFSYALSSRGREEGKEERKERKKGREKRKPFLGAQGKNQVCNSRLDLRLPVT